MSGPLRLVDYLLAADVDSEGYWTSLDQADEGDWRELVVLAVHPDLGVRRAFVSALPLMVGDPPPEQVVDVVMQLTVDPAAAVRDHACFVLAEQWRQVDTPSLREALAARLDDVDRDTRCEALIGLAYRGDSRAAPRVRTALSRESGDVWRLEMLAAGVLGDSRLHPLVVRHLDGWDEKDSLTIDAVERLTDPAGPGADLFHGVAELYRGRAQGRANRQWLKAWQLMDEMLDLAPHRAQEFFGEVSARLAGDDAALLQLKTQSALSSLLEPSEEGRDQPTDSMP